MAGNFNEERGMRAEAVLVIRQFVATSMAIGLGGMWMFAGVNKLRSPLWLVEARRSIGGPAWMSTAVARALPLAEIALGIPLLLHQWVREAALVSFALLVSFTGVLGVALFRAVIVGGANGAAAVADCGCFGQNRRKIDDSGPARQDLRMPTVDRIAIRNVMRPFILAIIAWIVAFA
jgi:hypothetical protein